MLKDEIEINQFRKRKKNQLMLSFETHDPSHEPMTNP
jgi:hypothetical protein